MQHKLEINAFEQDFTNFKNGLLLTTRSLKGLGGHSAKFILHIFSELPECLLADNSTPDYDQLFEISADGLIEKIRPPERDFKRNGL